MQSNVSLRVDVRNFRNLRGGGGDRAFSCFGPVQKRTVMSSQFLSFWIRPRGEGNLDPEDDNNYCDIADIGLVQLLFQ
jgi:hypothetical protein